MASDDRVKKQNTRAKTGKDRKVERKRARISGKARAKREGLAGSTGLPDPVDIEERYGAKPSGKGRKRKRKSVRESEHTDGRRAAAAYGAGYASDMSRNDEAAGSERASERRRERRLKYGAASLPVSSLNRSRLAFGLGVLLILTAALIIRMGYWQIFKSDELRVMAADMQKVDTEIDPVRGAIYDSQMNTLAESVTEYELYAYTQTIYKADNVTTAEKARVLAQMAEITGKESGELKKLLEGTENLVLIAEGLTREQVEQAEKVFGSNVVVKTRAARYYPNGAFAAQVLGGVSSDNNGRAGLEYEYNSTLAGIKGRTVRTTDSNGDTLSNSRGRYFKAQDGYSIVTTIDSVIQHFVEDALEEGMARTGADAITCIVMEPKTGNILAMATTPEYDPNKSSEPSDKAEKARFDKMSDAEQTDYLSSMWRINAVSDVYEPGSTFKLIAAAAALESGSADSKSRYNCSGGIGVDGYYLQCLHTHGTQSLKEAVGNSCNPALARVALDMGAVTFYNYIDLFGFNDQTGVDLPGEGYSLVKDPVGMSRVDLATTGYGQGIAVTPLQILCAVNSLGNDGVLMKPKIVSKVIDSKGETVKEMKDVKVRQVVSKATADKMRDIMEYYVSDAGGTTAYVPGYRVGGKTGTANRVSGKSYSAATNTSFVVMAPMDDPKLSMICIVYRPTKLEYGAFTAGPIVKEISEKSLEYLGVERKYSKSEEKAVKKDMVRVPDVTGMDSSEAIAQLRYYGFSYTVMPESSSDSSFVVVDQHPKAGSKAQKKSMVYIYSE